MKTISKDLKNLSILALLLILVSPIFPYTETEAAAGSTYFGGKINTMTPCTCNTDGSSQVILSGSKSSGSYLYIPANKTYSKRNVNTGKYILGKYKPSGICLVGAQPYCTELPISKGTIDFTGTS